MIAIRKQARGHHHSSIYLYDAILMRVYLCDQAKQDTVVVLLKKELSNCIDMHTVKLIIARRQVLLLAAAAEFIVFVYIRS
jgi:hypothetical protein